MLRDAGLPRASSAYGLRHTFASLMASAGHSATDIAAAMGNSVAVVLATYAHSFEDADRQLAATLQGRLTA